MSEPIEIPVDQVTDLEFVERYQHMKADWYDWCVTFTYQGEHWQRTLQASIHIPNDCNAGVIEDCERSEDLAFPS